jgi:hypothetical protein
MRTQGDKFNHFIPTFRTIVTQNDFLLQAADTLGVTVYQTGDQQEKWGSSALGMIDPHKTLNFKTRPREVPNHHYSHGGNRGAVPLLPITVWWRLIFGNEDYVEKWLRSIRLWGRMKQRVCRKQVFKLSNKIQTEV